MSNGVDSITVHIESMLSKIPDPKSFKPKLYKVDQTLRQVNERAYDPGLVAIGPIHHNKDHLKDMEQIKVSYLRQFLQRNNGTVYLYVRKLIKLEEKARNCYSDFIQLPKTTEEFVEMLLLDGFFIIVLLLKLEDYDDIEAQGWRVQNEYIFHSIQVQKRVVADLLLVENQLPFFVLSALFDMTKPNHTQNDLSSLVLRQLSWVLPWTHRVESVALLEDQNHDDHLLGVVHRASFSRRFESFDEISAIFETINTVSELDEMGFSFQIGPEGPMDVSFTTSNQVIQVSKLTVEDYTETLLRNFIAYEQMHPNIKQKYVSDYSVWMTYLVKSSRDIEILRRAGIYENVLGDDETVHRMFNQLARDVLIDRYNFCYTGVSVSVIKHCRRRRNKWMSLLRRRCRDWMAMLWRNYFNSPWAIMSVIAAIVLLFLTTVQTYYSVLSYEK